MRVSGLSEGGVAVMTLELARPIWGTDRMGVFWEGAVLASGVVVDLNKVLVKRMYAKRNEHTRPSIRAVTLATPRRFTAVWATTLALMNSGMRETHKQMSM